MYAYALRPLLFCLSPEVAHRFSLAGLRYLPANFFPKVHEKPCQVMGVRFPNSVGLAAGFDKDGDYIDALGKLGFGFIELGTVTPKPQLGNKKPRLFRLPKANALINRMGFNNKGVDYVIEKVQQATYKGVLGINIGKNLSTPVEEAIGDYLTCFDKVYPYADYIAVNISSPNTPDLRQLQYGEKLTNLLSALKQRQQMLKKNQQRYVPLVIKVAPDLTTEQISELAQAFLRYNIDGVIATNTTIDHQAVASLKHGQEQGGVSGQPLLSRANQLVAQLYQHLGETIPIIGVGGILCKEDAQAKLAAGAKLVQLYTGLIYCGPSLLASCSLLDFGNFICPSE